MDRVSRSAGRSWRSWRIISRGTVRCSFPKRCVLTWAASTGSQRDFVMPPSRKKQLRILVSNDDGIHAPGLVVDEQIARTLSDDIWVVAPETEQSGASHSLTLTLPLRLRQAGHQRYALSGTPTDCVMMAGIHLMKDRLPDLVISGVNRGFNVADDVTYSGTVAAAMEGTVLGIPSIAMS